MILKSLSRKSNPYQLVSYIFRHDKSINPKPLVKHNLRSTTIKDWVKEIEDNEILRMNKRKDNVKVFHTIISFGSKDSSKVTNELLKDIVSKFIELRGCDNIYLSTVHTEKNHQHLHILMPGTKYLTGESNRISKSEFHKLKIDLELYQREKYPWLVHSQVNHNKSGKSFSKAEVNQVHSTPDLYSEKLQLLQNLDTVYNGSQSLDHFLSQLKSAGYTPYYRGGKLYGLDDGNRHYRFKTLGFSKEKIEDLERFGYKERNDLHDIRQLREAKNQEYTPEPKSLSEGQDKSNKTQDLEFDGQGL